MPETPTPLRPPVDANRDHIQGPAAQGRFWDMVNYLFEQQDGLDRDGLIAAATALELDADRFARELDDHTYAECVDAHFAHARDSGAHTTPTFFINGRRYDEPWDEASVLEAIREPLG